MDTVTLVTGLPLATLSGQDKAANQKAVQDFLQGTHTWTADGVPHTLIVESVVPASQPVGALYDWLLTSDGKLTADKRALFAGEIGIINIGMNTADLMVTDNRQSVEGLTAFSQLGVRRLLELSNRDALYTMNEMDARLRAGKLDTTKTLPVWADEIKGFIDREWGQTWRRFTAVVLVGGGSILLQDVLARKFGALAQASDDAVLSTAWGLRKFSLLKKYDNPLAIDFGFGAIKVVGAAGSIILPSAVAINGRRAIGELTGLKAAARPLHIETDAGAFYVGAGAHRFGRAVQSLDLDRVSASPEMRGLFLAAMTKYQAIDLAE